MLQISINTKQKEGVRETHSEPNRQKQPPEVSYKKAVLKKFGILTVKHLRWSLFLIKLQVFETFPVIIANKCFPVITANFLRTPFEEHQRTAAPDPFLPGVPF